MKIDKQSWVMLGVALILGTLVSFRNILTPPSYEELKKQNNTSYQIDKIDPILYELFTTWDKNSFARKKGLDLKDSKVRVTLVYLNAEYVLPPMFGEEITRSADSVMAYVNISKLLDLTKEPSIIYIRTPLRPNF